MIALFINLKIDKKEKYDYSNNKKKYTFLAKNNKCVIFITNKFPHMDIKK